MRALAVLVVVSACTTTTPAPVEVEIPAQLPTPLDVLVVVDDTSLSTARIPDPANLGGVLEGIYNGAPDLRIAVTTTTTGTLRTSAIVPGGVIEHAVRMEDGLLATNFTGDLATAINSLLVHETSATTANQALASAVRALGTGNFVRSDAALGILLVSATDDESADAPAVYAAAIEARASRTMVSAVDQRPATRIGEFLGSMTRRFETPIAAYDMEAISVFAGMFAPTSGDGCFPLAVARAADCQLATADEMVSHPLHVCDGEPLSATSPCFALVPEASCSSGWGIGFGGAYRAYHPTVFGRCRL